jgi:Flp pilus assembly pilin Flp
VTGLKRCILGLLGDRRGATAVEFAMVAGPLLLLLFGTIEFGRLMWLRQALEETATVGARCMGIPQPECMNGGAYSASTARAYILAEASAWGLAVDQDDLVINRASTCSGLADFSTVSITYSFSSAAPALLEALDVGPTFTSQVCFPNQGD